jgi:hypothetical protein
MEVTQEGRGEGKESGIKSTRTILSYVYAKPSLIRIPQPFSNLVIIYLLAFEDRTECSETSAYKIQTPGNYPEEIIQRTEQGESLKSRRTLVFMDPCILI